MKAFLSKAAPIIGAAAGFYLGKKADKALLGTGAGFLIGSIGTMAAVRGPGEGKKMGWGDKVFEWDGYGRLDPTKPDFAPRAGDFDNNRVWWKSMSQLANGVPADSAELLTLVGNATRLAGIELIRRGNLGQGTDGSSLTGKQQQLNALRKESLRNALASGNDRNALPKWTGIVKRLGDKIADIGSPNVAQALKNLAQRMADIGRSMQGVRSGSVGLFAINEESASDSAPTSSTVSSGGSARERKRAERRAQRKAQRKAQRQGNGAVIKAGSASLASPAPFKKPLLIIGGLGLLGAIAFFAMRKGKAA